MERRPGFPKRFSFPRPVPFSLALLASSPGPLLACAYCRPAVQAQVYDARFWPQLSILILPIAVIGLIAALIHFRGEAALGNGDEKGPMA
jgi:hypothetical protein